jgi:hypothetical protein
MTWPDSDPDLACRGRRELRRVRFYRIGNVAEVCHLKGRVHNAGLEQVWFGSTKVARVVKLVRLRGRAVREVPNGGVPALEAMLSQT